MVDQEPLTTEEKEAVLKMAGVLIRTVRQNNRNVYKATNITKQQVWSYNRDKCITTAFNRLRESTNEQANTTRTYHESKDSTDA